MKFDFACDEIFDLNAGPFNTYSICLNNGTYEDELDNASFDDALRFLKENNLQAGQFTAFCFDIEGAEIAEVTKDFEKEISR